MPELLHGILKVTIFEVDRLHTGCHLDFCQKVSISLKLFTFLSTIISCYNLFSFMSMPSALVFTEINMLMFLFPSFHLL